MIVDHRSYTIRPSRIGAFLTLWETVALPIQLAHAGRFMGMFTTDTGPLNTVVHLWAYEDAGDRERRRATFEALPEWQDYRCRLEALDAVEMARTMLLRPARFVTLDWSAHPISSTGS